MNVGRSPGQSQDRWVQLLGETGHTLEPASPPTSHAPLHGGRQRTDVFRQLHAADLFIMPNPWDRGSARLLQEKGFPALATTSSGFGRAIGKDDQEVTRDELVAHVADLTSFITVPLNVDSERLFPDEPGGITETVRLLAAAGASGLSIEDYNPQTSSIDPIGAATEAVAEAVEAGAAHDIVLTARAENLLYGVDDLDDTVERLAAYGAAGAEVLYAPGLADIDLIELVVDSVDQPINVLARPNGPSVESMRAVGVRRVSIGGAMFNATAATLRAAADELLSSGTSTYAAR
ncbi:MAG: isocitrate lyase/phosphoenolpyruvate mutase family protein [Acidimicrobiales bacterium]|nr:MAG: isocitrate lyase/phosphoenolpyruvate mutase family protein [Acidimicrobiales bacterium]